MQRLWRNYSLSIILGTLFLLSWMGQGVSQGFELAEDAKEHGQVLESATLISGFLSATFENWQSEFLQLFSFVVFATYFIHKNSPQSRDGDDRMMKKIENIEKMLQKKGGGKA